MALEWCEKRRFLIYLGLFLAWNLYDFYKQYLRARFEATQMEILEASFKNQNQNELMSLVSALGFDDDEDDGSGSIEI